MGKERKGENLPVERVSFASGAGSRLAGLWHAGSCDSAVILLHGMESCKEGVKHVRLARALNALGHSVLRFDFRYVGESDGRFEDLTVSGEVEDATGAWAYVRSRIPGPVGIIGSSLGGTVALLFAAATPGVAAVATIAAPARPGRLARSLSADERERWRRQGSYDFHGTRLGVAFLEDVERLDVAGSVAAVRCPVLLTHGTEDRVVPPTDVDVLAGAMGENGEVRRYAGADHRFSDPALLDRLMNDLTTWIHHRLSV